MALWPFGKKNKDKAPAEANEPKAEPAAEEAAPAPEAPAEQAPAEGNAAGAENQAPQKAAARPEGEEPAAAPGDEKPAERPEPADAAPAAEASPAPEGGGETGPFDGDTLDITEFNFADFAVGILNLGSMRVPMPKGSQVQVEMSDKGPRMVHILTPVGRLTPVAFAAPTSGGLWEDSISELTDTMRERGMAPELDSGPWGREIVTATEKAESRVIGADGPRWMLRITAAGPKDKAAELADLAREVTARTFVYRGEKPILAGKSLPVVLPPQLAKRVAEAVRRRQDKGQGQAPQGQAAQQNPGQKPPQVPGQGPGDNRQA